MPYKYSLRTLQRKAEMMAEIVQPPRLILLRGTLGAGKTAFARFFIKKLAGDIVVSSPTFNIVQIYESSKGYIWHVDLYRIENVMELTELGVFEAIHQNICLIEWPDILESYIDLKNENYLHVTL